MTPAEILVPSRSVIPAGLYHTADGLSAWPTNAPPIAMAAESWSGSLKPAAKLPEENIVIPATVTANIAKTFFIFVPPSCRSYSPVRYRYYRYIHEGGQGGFIAGKRGVSRRRG